MNKAEMCIKIQMSEQSQSTSVCSHCLQELTSSECREYSATPHSVLLLFYFVLVFIFTEDCIFPLPGDDVIFKADVIKKNTLKEYL